MKAVITGIHGTVGSALKTYLEEQGVTVIGWDRTTIPIDEYHTMENYLRSIRPDVLFHLAIHSQDTGRSNESFMVNYHWTSELAWITKTLGIKFIYTSTVMVFSDDAKGPFTVFSKPDAAQGYGYEKRISEQRVFYQNRTATVARLGWQIGNQIGNNTMITYFEKCMTEQNKVKASTKWYPACSFLEDTVAALYQLAFKHPGLYLLDSNTHWNFYEIANALNEVHNRRWNIVPSDHFIFDQRMFDERISIPSLKEKLPTLPHTSQDILRQLHKNE